MLQMSIRVTGSKQTIAKLNRLGKDLHDMKRAMKQVGEDAADYYANKAFNSRGGVFGQKWAPLSAKYKARKAKLYRGKGILEATGTMKDSFVSVHTRTSATVTNTAPQFKYHQSTAPRKKMPRRAMMDINKPIKSMVKRAVEEEIRRKLRTA